ncbi:hypothetical protein [Bifidobacterium castoris]|uniref:Uncharacterized protein n=1 Tax=Bifidobacterium castoris TaxID=2306972 RepID=A0A430FAB7_9BIFI|nr:hypothetical protein [Bifidobacterium castoris]RSX49781.1 hypothetical protein D2E22_0242 [Bifidobacterium castoris]
MEQKEEVANADNRQVWLDPQSETFERDVQKLGGRLMRLQTGNQILDPNKTAPYGTRSEKDEPWAGRAQGSQEPLFPASACRSEEQK